jgi:hypothetical protein
VSITTEGEIVTGYSQKKGNSLIRADDCGVSVLRTKLAKNFFGWGVFFDTVS